MPSRANLSAYREDQHADRGGARCAIVSRISGVTSAHEMKLLRTVRNCRPNIPVPCPKHWDALSRTADGSVRHCETCDTNVYFCSTDEETLGHARAGHCIAREVPDQSELPKLVLGRPALPVVISNEQGEARQRYARERAIDDILSWDISAYDRACPACAYPVPNFRSSCRVCGAVVGRANPRRTP